VIAATRRGRLTVLLFGLLAACAPSAPVPPPSAPPALPPAAAPPPPPPVVPLALQPTTFAALPGWADDGHADALPALKRSCVKLKTGAERPPFGSGTPFGGSADWQRLCAEAQTLPAEDGAVRRFFEARFTPYRATAAGGDGGLFTGYYEPLLQGQHTRGGRYQVPLYRLPDDTVSIDLGQFKPDWKGQQLVGRLDGQRLVPLPTRAEIDHGAYAGRGLELVWVDDAVDAFFLQVQGSGRIRLPDGRVVRLGYAGKNGHPYTAIGAELVRRGELSKDAVSLQTIRDWLRRHPAEAEAVMALNASYVFFREVDGDGPIGSQGVALTPGRSLAVDPAYVPLGVPLWLDTTQPLATAAPLRRLVVAQDTGGAIKGPVRGDLFWGAGAEAEAAAGRMKQPGRYFLLLPRSAAAGPQAAR
jgi:membrane-bound lytic murein transglycosylase A